MTQPSRFDVVIGMRIRRAPIQTVAMAAGVGMLLGFAPGYAGSRVHPDS